MRRLLILMVTGALVLGACGSDDSSSGDIGDTTPDDGTTSSSPPLGSGDAPEESDGAEVVEPRPGMVRVMPTAFESAAPIDDGSTIAVRFWGGVDPCFVLDHVEVEQTDTNVTVTLYAGTDPEAEGQACILLAKLYETRITLDRPLGDRTVIDGALVDGA